MIAAGRRAGREAPTGWLRVEVICLEMAAPPVRAPLPAPVAGLRLVRAERPTVSFYRYLYNTVGERWLWSERRRLNDGELAAIVQDSRVEVLVLYAAGVPAGYAELDRRSGPAVDLAYFGLIPEFIGRGFGPYLLDRAIAAAWTGGASRLSVHTCYLDHTKALPLYQRMGFVPVRRATIMLPDPRLEGILPLHAGRNS